MVLGEPSILRQSLVRSECHLEFVDVLKKTDICRYSRVLAPKNFLSTPEEVFGEGKLFDKEVEEKTRLAFRVTMKKLDKLNTLSEERREDLAREKIDQVPNTKHKYKYPPWFQNTHKYKIQIQKSTRWWNVFPTLCQRTCPRSWERQSGRCQPRR